MPHIFQIYFQIILQVVFDTGEVVIAPPNAEVGITGAGVVNIIGIESLLIITDV